MKAIYEQIGTLTTDASCLFRRFSLPKFNAPFHYHPELELTLIEKGVGKRFVGSHIAQFEEGDLVLVGANVPHCWLNNDTAPTGAEDAAQALVVQFDASIFGEKFVTLPEIKPIYQLFETAQAGLSIKGVTRQNVTNQMVELYSQPPLRRLLGLLEILDAIAHSAEVELLDLYFSQQHHSDSDTERFRRIYSYLIENFRNDISLKVVADIAHLTPTAFCRYFKKITRKTLVEVITEFRIKHACFLLTTSNKPIIEVCFESGFGNVSYFNKEFKKNMGQTPLAYRKVSHGVGLDNP